MVQVDIDGISICILICQPEWSVQAELLLVHHLQLMHQLIILLLSPSIGAIVFAFVLEVRQLVLLLQDVFVVQSVCQ